MEPTPSKEEATLFDDNGAPMVALPPTPTLGSRLLGIVIIYGMVPLFLPLILLSLWVRGRLTFAEAAELMRTANQGHEDPIDKMACNTGERKNALLKQLWKSCPSAHHYRYVLEYQPREGYCSLTTQRCLLKSFESFPLHLVPEKKAGASNPDKWRTQLEEMVVADGTAHIPDIDIVRGDVSYTTFLETLQTSLKDENSRVAINYLRPALVGFRRPKWIPSHYVLGMFGGHFSPIVGILPGNGYQDPLVAVFDVNHKYGGTYFVPASRLYESVKALDVSTRQSRALIVLKMTK
jgi:hypothetical protein